MRPKEAVVLYGLSGVGKSTYTDLLIRDQSHYFAPVVVAARPPRPDDQPGRYEYVTLAQFRRLANQGDLSYCAEDGVRGYGIHYDHLHADPRTAIITCGSPYNIETPLEAGWINVAIVGDALRGLSLRETDPEFIGQRRKINQDLSRRFYSKLSFMRGMHIIFKNNFDLAPQVQAACLHQSVARRLTHARQNGGPYFVDAHLETGFYAEQPEHAQSYHLFPIQR